MPPADFIAVAEETGLIDQLGRWVLDAVCRQRLAWRSEGLDPRPVRSTSRRTSCAAATSRATSCDCLRRHGLEPDGLVMEITESAAMAGGVSTRGRSCASSPTPGLRIAVDDFGAGASSLGRLQQLPVQILKLDRSFLTDVPASAQASGLVRAIVDLSAALDARLVVEGVETEAQREFLVASGCPLAQGFLLGRPVPAAELDGLLRAAGRAPRHRRRTARRRVREVGVPGATAARRRRYRPNVRAARSGAERLTLSRADRPNVQAAHSGATRCTLSRLLRADPSPSPAAVHVRGAARPAAAHSLRAQAATRPSQ